MPQHLRVRRPGSHFPPFVRLWSPWKWQYGSLCPSWTVSWASARGWGIIACMDGRGNCIIFSLSSTVQKLNLVEKMCYIMGSYYPAIMLSMCEAHFQLSLVTLPEFENSRHHFSLWIFGDFYPHYLWFQWCGQCEGNYHPRSQKVCPASMFELLRWIVSSFILTCIKFVLYFISITFLSNLNQGHILVINISVGICFCISIVNAMDLGSSRNF